MWIRSAFWVGEPRDSVEFRSVISTELVPALKALPGVRDAEAMWPRRLEDNPPRIACQIDVRFDTEADIDLMLASPGRAALRLRVREIVAAFDGAISHIDFEVA